MFHVFPGQNLSQNWRLSLAVATWRH